MSLTHTPRTVLLVQAERIRQEELRIARGWAPLAEEDYHVLNTVIGEEMGEVSRAILEVGRTKTNDETRKRLEELRDEAIQVAAMGAMIAEKAIAELEQMSYPKAASKALAALA